MPWTMDTDVADGIYNLRNTLEDQIGEQIKKNLRLHNPATGDNIQDAMRAFEGLTDAGFVAASASLSVGVTDPSAVKGNSGDWSYNNIILILGFSRAHPLNASKTVTTTYAIPAPASALYTIADPPVINIGTAAADFASAAGIPDLLATMIAWLEDNLVFEDITGAVTVGGWTYDAGATGILSGGRLLDGVANS